MDNESTLTIDKFKNKQWRNAAGLLHRKNGPAVVFLNGEKSWWLDNINYQTKEDWFSALSDEAKVKCLFSEDFLNG